MMKDWDLHTGFHFIPPTDLEKQRTHTSSSTSHRLTRASVLPVAKYFPVGSNLMQMQFDG